MIEWPGWVYGLIGAVSGLVVAFIAIGLVHLIELIPHGAMW